MRAVVAEYFRPWKLATLAVGLGALLVGSDYDVAPDWDYPISFIMALSTYLTAPWSVAVFRGRRWTMVPLALFWYYFTVDGCYWLYWNAVNPEALVMREANFLASSVLYWLCGFIWLHDGPLRMLIRRPESEVATAPKALSGRLAASRLVAAVALFWVAYFIYSAATGEQRMTEVCRQIRPGLGVAELTVFAERHGLGPRRNLTPQTRLAYLAEARTMGRHACRVEFEGGKVSNAAYNYAD